MSSAFEITDVPLVGGHEVEMLVDILVQLGHARAVFKGHDAALRADVEGAFWHRFKGPTHDGIAALVRFWSLIDVLSSRRLGRLVLDQGFMVLKPLARVAARQRLNATWGFVPQRVLWAVAEELRAADAGLGSKQPANADVGDEVLMPGGISRPVVTVRAVPVAAGA